MANRNMKRSRYFYFNKNPEKNFNTPKMNVNKKKIAQEIFYNNQPRSNVTPLRRNPEQMKKPVHQRLGKLHFKKQPPQGVRKQNNRMQNQKQNVRFMRSPPVASVQNRLRLIRQKQNPMGSPAKQMKLNRTSNKPTSFLIEFKNPNNKELVRVPKHHNILNNIMQDYIRQIQSVSKCEAAPISSVPVSSTRIKLSDRFANY